MESLPGLKIQAKSFPALLDRDLAHFRVHIVCIAPLQDQEACVRRSKLGRHDIYQMHKLPE